MKVEVTIVDRGSITIKSKDEFTRDEIIDLAQRATRWLKGVRPAKNQDGSFGFGKE